MTSEATKCVIVTGSTGNLGKKAVASLERLEGWKVLRIGRNSAGEASVFTADLARFDPRWARHFEGADAVVHLAADPKPSGSWESVTRLNIDLGLNVFRAAEQGRVGRFVFASSNWVLGGYRFRRERLTETVAPRPVNPYGASKLFLERYGVAVAARTGMSVISLRIGYCQPGDNQPGPHMAFGIWGQQMWLGNRDWGQAVQRAVASSFTGSSVLNIVSRNEGMRWDIAEACRVIGYEPADHHVPALTLAGRVKEFAARLRDCAACPGSAEPLFGARW